MTVRVVRTGNPVTMFGSQRCVTLLVTFFLLCMHTVTVLSLAPGRPPPETTNSTDTTQANFVNATTDFSSPQITSSSTSSSMTTADSTTGQVTNPTSTTSQVTNTTDSTTGQVTNPTSTTSQVTNTTDSTTGQVTNAVLTTEPTTVRQVTSAPTDSTTSQVTNTSTDSTASQVTTTSQANITCSTSSVSFFVSEHPAKETCFSDVIQCAIPAGQTVADPTYSLIDGAAQNFFAQANRTSAGDQITICVNDTTFALPPGSYKWILGLIYIIDGSVQPIELVTVSTTVEDVNEAPVISMNVSSLNISEKESVGSSIYAFTVVDPDANVANGSAAYKTITRVDLTDPSGGDLIHLGLRNGTGVPGLFEIVVTYMLNASKADEYLTRVVAHDGGGLNASANITIYVQDENDAPHCAPNFIQVNVSVDAMPGSSLGKLECWDWDVVPEFRNITYSQPTQLPMLSVDDRGEISLRTAITDVPGTKLTDEIKVFAPNSPSVNTTVTVELTVTRAFSPDCTPVSSNITFLETDNVTRCQVVTFTCDLVVNNPGFLANYSSVYDTSLFQVYHNASLPQSSPNNVTVCPNADLMGLSGIYDLTITVESALANSSYRWFIEIEDVNQAPRFERSQYAIRVPEDAKLFQSLATVYFPGGNQVPMLGTAINVTDPDTAQNLRFDAIDVQNLSGGQNAPIEYIPSSQYFRVNGKLLPDESFDFELTAFDATVQGYRVSGYASFSSNAEHVAAEDMAGSTAKATVNFTVYDVNEAPSCQNSTLTVDVTSQVGMSIFNVSCIDRDVREEYKSLTYGEYETDDFEYFSISDAGEVTLTLLPPLNVSQLVYNVFARDGGNLTASVRLFVNINRNFPAECSPSSTANVTFLETDTIGTYSQILVTCVDSSGRNLPMEISVLSDETQGRLGVFDEVQNNSLVMQVFVRPRASTFLPAGQFEIRIAINNSLVPDKEFVFNITVEDLNQPPFFAKSTYIIHVPEKDPSMSGDRTIAKVRQLSDFPPFSPNITDIVMSDPDTWKNFTILSCLQNAARAEFENGTAYDGNFTVYFPITMNRSSIVAVSSLRPDLIYFVTLTVRDGQGLSGNTTLEIHVDDVNDPPSCPPRSPIDLDLLLTPQSVVTTIGCTDGDYETTFRTLRYSSYPVADYSFFRVEKFGRVKLTKSIPRDTLSLVLEAYAEDGGSLVANTTLTFSINRDHPPDCFPSYVPPSGVWEYNTCFRIYPNCSDPTTPNGDQQFLTYTFSGNWKTAFRENMSVSATVDYSEFCYFLGQDGNYKIQLNASNGLGDFTWEEDVVVNFQAASPRFDQNRYITQVLENATVGTSVLVMGASVDGKSVPLIYTFSDGGDVPQYFAINSSSGVITVAADLSPLAAIEAKTYVNVEDPQTGLNQSVPLSIAVVDVNDPPVCFPSTINVIVPWRVTKNDVIARVNCSDPDRTPGYSTLNYFMIDPEYVWTCDMSAIKLLARVNLQGLARVPVQVVTVRATDGRYSTNVTVNITIDRTPPEPILRLGRLTYNNVTINWQFPDIYRDVINSFTVTINGINSLSRKVVDKDSSEIVNVTGLMAEGSYVVVVIANGFDKNVSSDPLSFTLPMKEIFTVAASAEFKLTSDAWSSDLANPESAAYKMLAGRISSGVDDGLKHISGYVKTEVRSFRLGSLYADIILYANQSLTDTNSLKNALLSLGRGGTVGNVTVDSRYFQFYIGDVYINDLAASYDSTGKITNVVVSGYDVIVAGYDVTAGCSARTPGADTPRFDWELNGRNVINMLGSQRYSVSQLSSNSTDPYKFYSSITIRDIRTQESGSLKCTVTAGGKTVEKILSLRVVKKLTALINPPSVVVSAGSDVNLTCVRKAGYELPWQAALHRADGRSRGRSQVTSVNLSLSSDRFVFSIKAAKADERYQCQISDRLTSIYSKEAIIIITQPADVECPATGDWGVAPAGTTVQLECPQGYAIGGLQSRTCNVDGTWQEPDTSDCVSQQLEDLQATVDQIQEGTEFTSTEKVVETLENSTSGSLLIGDVITSVRIMDQVANITENTQQTPVGENQLTKYVQCADNVLHASPEVWQNRTSVAFSLVRAVDKMGETASKNYDPGAAGATKQPVVQTKKIVLQLGRSNRNDIQFPHPDEISNYPAWVTSSKNYAFLSKDAFDPSVGEVNYSAVIYRNLTNVFSGTLPYDNTGTSNLSINSPILALSLALKNVDIKLPIRLTFDHITNNFSATSCRFLDFSSGPGAVWSTRGCRRKSFNSSVTVCECDHLTNFAVLMSPYRPVDEIADVLNIFSIIGCSVSIFCLVLTLLIYFIFWRYVKSDRSVLLVNLCVVLILAYVTFLAGVNRVEHEIVCTVVAGLLHYLWLVVFFLMLCEGLDIYISIVIIFPIKSVLPWLLVMAYGVPLIIVGASLGITKLEGYGGSDFCWLSLDDGLLWAFVGPALAALLANFVFVALVIRALLSSTAMITKAARQRAKSILKAICVMTPILGLTWIFGVMSVNNETIIFQILFVAFNSLQGLMIFVLYCLLSKQVRDGIQNRRRRYRAKSGSTDNTLNKYSTQKHSSESSANDLDKKITNPFLQADRQVQQMASKVAMLDNPNLLTASDPPKPVGVKDPVAKATGGGPVIPAEAFNIQLNESTTDSLPESEEVQLEPAKLTLEPEFIIQAGNLKTIIPNPSPQTKAVGTVAATTAAKPMSGHGQGRSGGTPEATSQISSGSVENNARQEDPKRLEHVYGPGARLSDSFDNVGRKQAKHNSRHSSQSSDSVQGSSAPKNPVFNDAVAVAPTSRWVRVDQPTKPPPQYLIQRQPPQHQQHQQHMPPQQSLILVRRPGNPAPAPQTRPPASPRRMATSAESLSPAQYQQPFAIPRPKDGRPPGNSKKQPPRVATKPSRWHQEPPVDYW